MWSGMKQRLGFKRMGCCAATWSPDASPMALRESTAEDEPHPDHDGGRDRATVTIGQVLECGFGARQTQGMNLAAALEAERNLRGGGRPGGMTTLMRLIEETDGVDLSARRLGERRKAGPAADGAGGGEWLCCVCMEREKGAAFIPCGHAYCRECSRELCLGRGRCPVCNRSIVDILHLF
ncbi:hypothetical protein MLD38_033421 [Melastoma candidum]|uniref:Uncharacterized protein n=1 Tax=Melastoma candidum TaxID=119954 RepID=A0ACB9M809_9MYRT|nr:hypothetical protein MLD38_033421 [Melastoma candidum]